MHGSHWCQCARPSSGQAPRPSVRLEKDKDVFGGAHEIVSTSEYWAHRAAQSRGVMSKKIMPWKGEGKLDSYLTGFTIGILVQNKIVLSPFSNVNYLKLQTSLICKQNSSSRELHKKITKGWAAATWWRIQGKGDVLTFQGKVKKSIPRRGIAKGSGCSLNKAKEGKPNEA